MQIQTKEIFEINFLQKFHNQRAIYLAEMTKMKTKDLFGQAILDYQLGNYTENIKTETDISEEDELPIPYLFRTYQQMPSIERKALDMAFGSVLDVGCGAGVHALYLESKNMEVTSIDISEKAIEACRLRGVKNALVQDIMTMEGQFDTILLLMNGTGMCGRLRYLDAFLQKLKSLLTPNGQILTDSSDIIYMFDQNQDGSYNVPMLHQYYGEVNYIVRYKNEQEPPFQWMYIDYNTLQNAVLANQMVCKLIQEGEHFDYLAQITLK